MKPFTKPRPKDSGRQALPAHGDEEIELARVYLELNSRIQTALRMVGGAGCLHNGFG